MAYAAWSVVFGEQPSAAKWNIIGTNMSGFNDGTAIGDSAILPKHLFTGTGSTHVWAAYTPTITANGGTFTSVAATGAYIQYGKTVHARITVTVTTLGTATGSTVATLPITAKNTNDFVGAGRGDVVTGTIYQARLRSATTVDIYKYDGTMGQANTEVTRCLIIYEAA